MPAIVVRNDGGVHLDDGLQSHLLLTRAFSDYIKLADGSTSFRIGLLTLGGVAITGGCGASAAGKSASLCWAGIGVAIVLAALATFAPGPARRDLNINSEVGKRVVWRYGNVQEPEYLHLSQLKQNIESSIDSDWVKKYVGGYAHTNLGNGRHVLMVIWNKDALGQRQTEDDQGSVYDYVEQSDLDYDMKKVDYDSVSDQVGNTLDSYGLHENGGTVCMGITGVNDAPAVSGSLAFETNDADPGDNPSCH